MPADQHEHPEDATDPVEAAGFGAVGGRGCGAVPRAGLDAVGAAGFDAVDGVAFGGPDPGHDAPGPGRPETVDAGPQLVPAHPNDAGGQTRRRVFSRCTVRRPRRW